MKLENLFEYLVPIAVLVLYFLSSMRKQKKEQAPRREEPQEELAPTRWTPPSVPKPPVYRRQEVLHSKIEDRKVASSINTREYTSAITERQGPVSSGMLEHLDSDPAYAHKVRTGVSRAKKLFQNKESLRNAVLLQEVLRRPYE
jgi:hypothetical protein